MYIFYCSHKYNGKKRQRFSFKSKFRTLRNRKKKVIDYCGLSVLRLSIKK